MLNKAILMGRLTRDPELKYTTSNIAVTSFTVAVDRNYSGNGEKQTDFINVVAWRKTAEFVCQYFTKGMLIIIDGSIQSRNWQDKNGNDRVSIEVLANNVQFGETKKAREATSGNYQPQENRRQQSYGNPASVEPDDGFVEMDDDDGEIPF